MKSMVLETFWENPMLTVDNSRIVLLVLSVVTLNKRWNFKFLTSVLSIGFFFDANNEFGESTGTIS